MPFLSARIPKRLFTSSGPRHNSGSASEFLRSQAENEESAHSNSAANKPRSRLNNQDKPWDGDESIQDAVLRMLVDKYKPLRIPGWEKKIQQPDKRPIDHEQPIASTSALPPHGRRHPLPWEVEIRPPRGFTPQPSVRYGLPQRPLPAKRKVVVDRTARVSAAKEASAYYSDGDTSVRTSNLDRYRSENRRPMGDIKDWTSLVEDRIDRARREGVFKNVRGRGQPLVKDIHEGNPYLDRTEFLMNRIVQRQGAAPPWIVLQQEVDQALDGFRAGIRASWTRRAVRLLGLEGVSLITPAYIDNAKFYRDLTWANMERGYHEASIKAVNDQLRIYNAIAPYAVRRTQYTLADELEACYKDCAADIQQQLRDRVANADKQKSKADQIKFASGSGHLASHEETAVHETMWSAWKRMLDAMLLEPADWPDPSQLTSYQDILDACRFFDKVETAVDARLDELLADQKSLNLLLDQLDDLEPVVHHAEVDVRELAVRVDNTAQVAERISGQVRKLDEEQSRVRQSMDMLQAVQDLKSAILAISISMDRQDWETATRHMQRALAIDQAIIDSEFAQAVVPTSALPQPPAQTLAEIKQTMLERFLLEFEKASSARDEANTSRYFKLFPMIGHQSEGLDAYATFVCGLISSRGKLASKHAKAGSSMYFAAMLTPLFEQIAVIISQHQPVVEKYYGRQSMLTVIERLQSECDKQALAILDQWSEERRIKKYLIDASGHRFTFLSTLAATPSLNQTQQSALPAGSLPLHLKALNASLRGVTGQAVAAQPGQGASSDEELVDPKDVDAIVGELAMFSSRWQLFRRFLHARLSAPPVESDAAVLPASATLSASEGDLSPAETSQFQQALQKELEMTYIPLELWYMRVAVEKAHAIDEPDFTAQPAVSSALDDFFFILKKVLGRVMATANASSLTSMARSLCTFIERDFAHIMRRRIEAAATVLNQLQGRGDERDRKEREARALYLVYMNDLDLACDYLSRLLATHANSQSLEQVFFAEIELAQAATALAHLKTADDALKATIKAGLDQLFNQLIRPKIRPLVLECFKDISYLLDEDEYASAEYDDYVFKRFARQWDSLVEPFRTHLTENNYQGFFAMTVAVLVRPMEAAIRGMRFTELGALRLDRDVRSIVSHLSEQTPFGTGALREAFTRLQQIATLLSSDPTDATELVSSNGFRLTQAEVNTLLQLKVP